MRIIIYKSDVKIPYSLMKPGHHMTKLQQTFIKKPTLNTILITQQTSINMKEVQYHLILIVSCFIKHNYLRSFSCSYKTVEVDV